MSDEEKRDELEEKQEDAAEERAEEEKVIVEKPHHEKIHHEKIHHEKQKHDFNSKSMFNKDNKILETVRGNPWVVSTFVMGAVVLVLLFTSGGLTGSITGGAIGVNEAGEKLLNFYSDNGAEGLILDSVKKENGLYKVNFEYQGAIVPMYMTLDGKLAGNLNPIEPAATGTGQQQPPQDMPKSDKPVVELFVMTHCPYGTQAEKGFLPTIVALGDKIDASVKFVHYFLHDPEETETPVQICIREEQPDKFNAYLKEFLAEGDTDASIAKAGIDKAKLDKCIADRYDDLYAADSALSEGYGVQGSPTLVVNGVIVQSGRSADSYLQTICGAFNTAPEECSTLELDSETPGPGFGYGTTSSVANAQC
jgi:protein-disulfide isomerase